MISHELIARNMVETLRQNAAQLDAEAAFPTENLSMLRQSGLMGLLVPASYGGGDGTLRDLVQVAKILSTGCLSTAMIWAMHSQQVDVISRFGPEKLRAAVLSEVASGSMYIASVTTELGSGGSLLTANSELSTSTSATTTFTRQAPIVTGGEHADGYLITMRASGAGSSNRTCFVFASRNEVQSSYQHGWDPLGMRATQSVGMRITASVPSEHVFDNNGDPRSVAIDALSAVAHLGWTASWLGAATSGLQDFVRLVRSQGRPASTDPTSDLFAERLARVRIDLELVSAYLDRCCAEVMQHRDNLTTLDNPQSQIHLNTLKIAGSELTFSAANRLIQLAGLATGYLKTSPLPLERHFRDLRSAALNYSNDRLLVATGKLCLLDRATTLI